MKYDIAAYVWPAYTGDDPLARIFWPEGIGEWQSVKNSVQKYPGHNWPRKPLWGYVNEGDSRVMEMEIDCAADHGVNVFAYDWYWYDNKPFLETCLDNGYLKARNNERVKFYLMWANHNVNFTWDIRNSHIEDARLWTGATDRRQTERVFHRMIDNYLHQPTYYTIDGRPLVAIYDVANFVGGLGGETEARKALDWFRLEAEKSGLPGLHLQLIMWGELVNFTESGFDGTAKTTTDEIVKRLNFDSITNYQLAHFIPVDRDYSEILKDLKKELARVERTYTVPYFPHLSVGWDNNPRFQGFRPGVVKNNTPAQFREGLRLVKDFADAHPNQPPLITINSWNEWTETSYLMPDDLYGYGYLEAIKNVFLDKNQ